MTKTQGFRQDLYGYGLVLYPQGLREYSRGITFTAQKMKFSMKYFFSKCDQIRSFLKSISEKPTIFLLKPSRLPNQGLVVKLVYEKYNIICETEDFTKK